MPKISIITPVYNVEQYLARCVESILVQTFMDFELILINDGSPDNCGAICDEYAAKDSRIRVIHQENSGQAVARNRALDIAKGEYISFIDSDDYVHPRFLETLLDNIEKTGADVSVCRYKQTSLSDDYVEYTNHTKTYDGVEFVRKGLLGEMYCGVWLLWDKLYRAECFEGVRLPEGRINEDNATVYKILYECKKVVTTDSVLYYYFENQNSTVLQKFSKKHLDWLLVPEEMIAYFSLKNDDALVSKCNKMLLDSLMTMYRKVCSYLDEPRLARQLYKRLVRQYKSEKQKYPITVKTHPELMETLFPKRMWVYFTVQGILNKFKR